VTIQGNAVSLVGLGCGGRIWGGNVKKYGFGSRKRRVEGKKKEERREGVEVVPEKDWCSGCTLSQEMISGE